ncbi:MAG TPA: hypothetical protein PKE65_05600, partial [Rhizobiaceae bacterium]|nr:hypothetical protein [Rhizobiaceae bacterium]
ERRISERDRFGGRVPKYAVARLVWPPCPESGQQRTLRLGNRIDAAATDQKISCARRLPRHGFALIDHHLRRVAAKRRRQTCPHRAETMSDRQPTQTNIPSKTRTADDLLQKYRSIGPAALRAALAYQTRKVMAAQPAKVRIA